MPPSGRKVHVTECTGLHGTCAAPTTESHQPCIVCSCRQLPSFSSMDFVASGGRGRARSTSFHEDASNDNDLDVPVIGGRQRTTSFHEDSSSGEEDNSVARKGLGSGKSASSSQKKHGKVSRRTVEIMKNVSSNQQGKPAAKKKLSPEELAEKALEDSLRQSSAATAHGNQKEDDTNEEFDVYVKILLLGDSGVGKTCLLRRYQENNYKNDFISTMGIDYKTHYLKVDGKRVKCQIWDTAGQERFHVITRAFYKGAHGIVLVYDISDRKTFTNIEYWMNNISKHANQNVQKLFVGNKADLIKKRQTDESEAREVSEKHGTKYFETSAKTGINVEEAFYEIARQIVQSDGGKAVRNKEAGKKDQRNFEEEKKSRGKGKPKCVIS